MKRTLASLAGALLTSAVIAGPVMAQDSSGDAGDPASGEASPKILNPQQPGAETGDATQGGTQGSVQGAERTPDQGGTADTKKMQTGQSEDPNASGGAAGQTQMGEAEESGASGGTQKMQTGQTQEPNAAGGNTNMQTGQTQEPSAAQGGTQTNQAQDQNAPSGETTGSINITAEQQTELKQVFTTTTVEPADVDFDVSVGVAVPKTVTLHRLPPRVVELVPQYKEYQYFVLADGRIVIVEPATMEVVYILT